VIVVIAEPAHTEVAPTWKFELTADVKVSAGGSGT